MMIRTTCPTDDELRDFGTGRLSGDAVEQVAEHVEECSHCESRLAGFDAEPNVFTATPVKTSYSFLSG